MPADLPVELSVSNLSKSYGAIHAASGVSFEIRAGEIFGLLGPNGAGKTTTIESVIGLTAPDAGDVRICGIDARADPRAAREKIGVALQQTGIQDKITPREALHLFASFYRTPADPEALIRRFGLAEKADTRFETLSGGQKQRVALALAFVNNPAVIFLDEPTAGLDAEMRRELHAHMREMRDEGRAVLLTTHDMDEAEKLCDRIAVLTKGRIVAQGSPRDLIAGSRTPTTVSVETSAPPDLARIATNHIRDLATGEYGFRFTTSDVGRALGDLIAALDAQSIAITGLRAGKAPLEDVILELTRGRA